MMNFREALASLGPFDPRWLMPRPSTRYWYSKESYKTYQPNTPLPPTGHGAQSAPSICDRETEDGQPAENQLRMHDRDALKATLTPMNSQITNKSEKSSSATSSPPPDVPARKRKAEDGLPMSNKKSVKMTQEGRPRVSLVSKDTETAANPNRFKSSSTRSDERKNVVETSFASKGSDVAAGSKKPTLLPATSLTRQSMAKAGSASKDIRKGESLGKPIQSSTTSLTSLTHNEIAKSGPNSKGSAPIPRNEKSTLTSRTSIIPKTISKVGSMSKDAQLGSKPDKPVSTLSASSLPHRSTAGPAEPTRAIQDLNSPPPKKGSYRELMSRKASDMPKQAPSPPPPTGKQIKEAAKAAKMANAANASRRRHAVTRKSIYNEAKQSLTHQEMKRFRQEQLKQKFPRRAYNGTGATQVQAPAYSTTSVVETTAPLVRSESSRSASSLENSSNDMEAGYMDVEDEEYQAARTAKKEDEEEARLEAQLKKAKERRRMREAMRSPRRK